ncbi:MAG: transcriptional regulator [Bacilli bacterium]|nr:transcriptional regulator [Bacilli bacterium]
MDIKTTETVISKIQENAPLLFMKKFMKNKEGTGFIISYLYCHKDKTVYSKDLACNSGLSTARIAVALNSLEEAGCIERKTCSEDKRKTVVYLTDKGIEQFNKFKEETLSFCGKVIDELGIEKVNEYIALCKDINEAVLKIYGKEKCNV